MVVSINCKNIGEAWKQCIFTVVEVGTPHFDEDVRLLELGEGIALTIDKPQSHDPFIQKYGDPTVIERMLEKFKPDANMPDRPFTYGDLIYSKNGINQFEWIVKRILEKPETKSAAISLVTEGNNSPNLPCLISLDAKLRNRHLDLHFFFRSQNIFGRQYANLIALVELQIKMAKSLNCTVGKMSGYISSPHIYAYDMENAQKLLLGEELENKDQFYELGPRSIKRGYSKKVETNLSPERY
jgi:thymidylate synthase